MAEKEQRLAGGEESAGFEKNEWLIPAYLVFWVKFRETETCQTMMLL